jgi:hypothetical protein
MRLSKLRNLNPATIDKCAMVFVLPLCNAVKTPPFLHFSLVKAAMNAHFIAAFTSEK